ncbi:tyrosine-type recombinase/integrase [Sphingomonas sp. OTU376]|uniref:tyrosine-type recombinase/integrase n=1 Tax=Sphingomonas sp. OTU376 TaxID=3043863 RepID=UPI00313CF257
MLQLRQKLKEPGLHSDGAGLYLRVGSSGRQRSWLAIYHLDGRRREIGLGSADVVSLARAREKAVEVRELVDRGEDPIGTKRAKRAILTFGEVADQWIEAQTPNVRSDKSIARWKRALAKDGYSQSLRGMRVDKVSVDDVLGVLRPIWHSKATTARNVRVYIEAVLDAAKARKLRAGENPAAWTGNLEPLLGAVRRSSRGHAAVPWRVMPEFMAKLREKSSLAGIALDFIILTAARTSEVLNATWSEIDLELRTWTVPAARMKMGVEHTVALNDSALALLRRVRPEEPNDGAFIFGGEKPLSNMAAAMLMRRLGRSETVHGFRSSFRDWAGSSTSYPRELAEEALAHAVGDATERAYRREAAIERRRPLMADWDRFLAGGLAPISHL